ncbi:MAG: prolyl oligopeptidase family serine peptidase [Microscillaceae bacterium]|nr:prolyl oligopeptidase family serine peptidase [Microscillaceae bacterium]
MNIVRILSFFTFFQITVTDTSVWIYGATTSEKMLLSSETFYKDTVMTVKIDEIFVDIFYPGVDRSVGNILVLPGWNFPRQDWCQKSSLCRKASEAGYCLIFPEMGKSVYSGEFYPETLQEWKVYPGKKWVLDSLIPTLQKKYHLLKNNQKNYLLGLSTGGRGVALIALERSDLFKAGAALSGDFDQTQMPQDRLMIGFYGSYQQFPERWKGEDNPQMQIAKFQIPLYLGHGKQDKIVPPEQTLHFYEALKKAHPQLNLKLNMPDAGHDYAYWDSELKAVLEFFALF